MTGALTQVLEACQSNVRSVADIARTTGLAPHMVAACVDHLVQTGRLTWMPTTSLCPESACGSCALLPLGCKPRSSRTNQ